MIKFWGVEEVGNWLESLGLAEYRESFTKNDIRGSELLALDRPDLKVYVSIWKPEIVQLLISGSQPLGPCTVSHF